MRCHFSDLNELRVFLSQIEDHNHQTRGNWTAAQIFFHLASAFEGSTEGLPSGYPAVVRLILRSLRKVVTSYRFPPWFPIPKAIKFKLEPPVDLEFENQKSRLLNGIDGFEAYGNDYPPHPVLGKMTTDEWTGFHLRHCEHHLSFIEVE